MRRQPARGDVDPERAGGLAFYSLDPTILLWQDISLWNSEYQKLHNTQALKVSRDVSDPRKIYYNFHLKGGGYKFDPSTTHILHGRGSTGPLGVQLAVAMGCRPVILLGMDCKRGPKGDSDFYGENKHWTDATLKNCYEGLVSVKELCPVEVYNCGENTLWPQCSLEDVLKHDKIINIDENGKVHLPPPSDAVAGAFAVALADGFRNMGNDGSGDDVSHPANWSLGAWVVYAVEVTKLYGHPEDAPGGPCRTCGTPAFADRDE
ncbi:hypothetical protein LCGC14_3062030, partial [marine sediment metagenome]